ncbi:hypothetical protein ACL7TT_19360 [Microbulbifer sp. 2304DJ12-6]|uniref:hypothetical protein n=1 Tax=Microbulbifer sp. 2304DJ12-6 TaxID=3233340 RepID=UPI0039AF013C
MDAPNLDSPVGVREAVKLAGGPLKVARRCEISTSAVHKWITNERLPRTEYTGETEYAEILAALSGGKFNANQLLENLKPMKAATRPLIHRAN